MLKKNQRKELEKVLKNLIQNLWDNNNSEELRILTWYNTFSDLELMNIVSSLIRKKAATNPWICFILHSLESNKFLRDKFRSEIRFAEAINKSSAEIELAM